ncbi:MAG: ATP dependent DNA ligase, DNA ligase (ATP) [candidate division Kazan bacterium GW2011_GWA1_50_15]|uniref:DNA ligase (ATP) n=2 Tax=Bacteria division Kazan-3B-28 TaxID=1798534 RepID=A0A0G1X7I5_UNCK3|nr:MAG: ATP dependent DNA ligase, DNA ligase (ATP) [candidate division Kazan bacterium GW2011_GWA1_50_15]KKW25474.1 MAG: ligase, ATP-dependent protein [candidate division Kazan bacterium GW2011_GWC1_52_13]KKW26780.1 MAG: ligase, ATP-dependent protein [candidate division Kazan bacterium GW2011_GWB1_52_7]
MLCKPVDKPFNDKDWLFECKIDGTRIILVKHRQNIKLFTRRGIDRSRQFPEIVEVARKLPTISVVLDGELAATKRVASSFQALQPRMQQTNPAIIARLARTVPVVYHAFDILALEGKSVTNQPLVARKKLLKRIAKSVRIKYLEGVDGKGVALFAKAKRSGWEGIIGKKKDSKYLPGKRGYGWVKIKAHNEQELVIGGFTRGYGKVARTFGAVLVGYYARGKLKFAGQVGTGFTQLERRRLKLIMGRLKTARSPFADDLDNTGTTWIKPQLVGQFKFLEWTNDNILRAPVYLGLRDDKPANLVKKEA